MQFNSIEFMIYFPIVVAAYFVVPKKMRTAWLLVASYYFYMNWNVWYALLIGGSTIITYVSGLLLCDTRRTADERNYKKLVLIGCICVNLGILAVFKYGNFAIDSVDGILGLLNFHKIEGRLNLLLPVGISFYTFQALGYIIDVYRGDVRAERNFVNYALFVSFFPQLVAGPIERSKSLLVQIDRLKGMKLWDMKRVTSGAILMVWGFFMKMVIADRVAVLVNTVFDNYRMYGSTYLFYAALGFSIQIYCDFGSYSMIAIGAARIMGVELMENFNAPYFARSIHDFWNRWHISLSTWFKDYLYIPLGGNRRGRKRKCLNVMIVFLTSGLWHGANWTFVVWGAIHGAYQVLAEVTLKPRELLKEKMKIRTECFSWKLLQTFVTFLFVVVSWIFFRSDSITDALRYIKRMITRPTPWCWDLGLNQLEINILVFSLLALFLVELVRFKKNMTIDKFLFEQNLWFQWGVVIALIALIFVFGEYGAAFDPQQFIYFQF